MSKKTILIILFSVLSVMVTQISEAAVINVTTTHDNVPGSLRAAITTANNNGEANTIYLPAGRYLLSGDAREDANASGDLDIDTNRKLTIIGSGKSKTFMDGNGLDRVLHIVNGTVSISDLTIRKGKAPNGLGILLGIDKRGGGIHNFGNLILTRCIIKENAAGNGGGNEGDYPFSEDGGYGGGIYNEGGVTLNNCIVTGNMAGKGGDNYDHDPAGKGGQGGGIWNSGILTLNNCTITANSAGNGGYSNSPGYSSDGGHGGGVYNANTLNINNCTISSNRNGDTGACESCYIGDDGMGGGIYNKGTSQLISVTIVYNHGIGIFNEGSIRLKNSIVAYNMRTYYDLGPDCFGTFDWVCYSLIADTNDCTLTGFQMANILGQDPLLGPLADNGGPTYTHALLPGSPAIDAGNSPGLYTDQRSYKRPVNIPDIANVSDGADIGAYEFIPFSTAYSR